MYYIECTRKNEKLYVCADQDNLDCWSVSKNKHFYDSYEKAQYVYEQIISVSTTNLSDVTIRSDE